MLFSKSDKKDMRLGIIIDRIVWMLIWVLPFFAWRFQIEAVATTLPFLEWIDANYAWSFIKEIIDNVSTVAFGSTFALAGYISYLVEVEIIHVLFDIIVFIPRFAHKLMEKAVN